MVQVGNALAVMSRVKLGDRVLLLHGRFTNPKVRVMIGELHGDGILNAGRSTSQADRQIGLDSSCDRDLDHAF